MRPMTSSPHRPKVLTVFGTRPEAIKVAPLINALAADGRFESVTVTTGQHREMLAQVNRMFGIDPDYDLDLMVPGQSLNALVSRAIAGLDEVIERERPDAVISQGDTSTAMAAAIAAFNREIPVVHLEAGLRTGNLHSPFPEEANRRLISQVASLHLAPTEEARQNLIGEGFDRADVVVTGNTVIDALLEATSWPTEFRDPRLAAFLEADSRVVVITTHRRENLDVMNRIGRAMRRLADQFSQVRFVFPAHLNPRVREAMLPALESAPNVLITDPLPYDEFTKLLSRSTLIISDSGGVQEEAPSLGKPVLVLRENSERPEAVVAGTVRLVGTDETRIVAEAAALLSDADAYACMANAVNPYGDGHAAARAVAAIAELTGVGTRMEEFDPKGCSDDA